MLPCTGTEDLYRHWGSVQALRLCTDTEALYRHWGSVQALRLCTGRTVHRGSRGIVLPFHAFMTTALEGDEGSASRLGHSLLPGKTRYPLYRRLCGPQGRCGKYRPPPGFDLRTVQPVASRYTDWATRPQPNKMLSKISLPQKSPGFRNIFFRIVAWLYEY